MISVQDVDHGHTRCSFKSGSYRKITIGNTNQKIVHTHVTPDTGKIAKKAQPSTQYGFTEKTNYLMFITLLHRKSFISVKKA